MLDTVEKKSLDFGFFEKKSHDEVIDIFIFDEFSSLFLSKLLQTIDIGNNWDHKLNKDTNLVNDSWQIWKRNSFKMVIKFAINGFEESSKGVFLKHIGPFEKEMKWWRIVWHIYLFFVKNINLNDKRLIFSNIYGKWIYGFFKLVSFLFLHLFFIFKDQAWISKLIMKKLGRMLWFRRIGSPTQGN